MPLADTVAADDFFRLAEYLERITNDGLTRVDRRVRITREITTVTNDRMHWYTGNNAQAFAGALNRARDEAARAEPATGDAYRALQALAIEARRVGGIVREADQYEKSWNQQVVANWSEWQDRTTTAVAAAVGSADDRASEELTRRYQQLTADTEAASERRRVALHQWRDACTRARTELSSATDGLNPLLTTTQDALVQPERSYHQDAARDRIRLAWFEAIELKLEAGVDEPTLKAWWEGLSREDRALLMSRGDLITRYLWPVMNDDDRRQFFEVDKFAERELEKVLELELTIPVGPVTARGLGRVSVKEVQTSDGKSELTIDFSVERAIGGSVKIFGFDLGSTERLVLTKTFDSTDISATVRAELSAALQADAAAGDRDLSRTRAALAKNFAFDAERAKGQVAQLVATGAGGGVSASVKERLLAGTYARSDGTQTGVFLQASVEVAADSPHAQATAQVTVDGKLYLDDDDRRFVELAYKGDVSASVNPRSPYKALIEEIMARSDALKDLDLPESGLQSTGLTLKVEVTDSNRDLVAGMLEDLASQKIDQEKALTLLDHADVVLTTASGSLVIVRPPANPLIGGQVSDKDAKTEGVYHKPPGGEFYRQSKG